MSTSKQIVAFCHFKGGVGTSFLASNVAYEIAKNKILTNLIDFDTKLPNSANMLGLEVKKENSLYRYFSNNSPEKRGQFFINDKKLSPYLYVLSSSSEDEVEILEDINDGGNDVNSLLNVAKDTFDIVIVDLPIDYMNPQVIGTIEKADKVLVIGDLDINTIENSFRSLQMYSSLNIPLSKFIYIANKYIDKSDINLKTIQNTLGIRIGPSVPFDYIAAYDSILKSQPIVDSEHKITEAIRKICSMITGSIVFEENNKPQKSKEELEVNAPQEEVAPMLFTFIGDENHASSSEKQDDENENIESLYELDNTQKVNDKEGEESDGSSKG